MRCPECERTLTTNYPFVLHRYSATELSLSVVGDSGLYEEPNSMTIEEVINMRKNAMTTRKNFTKRPKPKTLTAKDMIYFSTNTIALCDKILKAHRVLQ